jgi:hypothetical protein
MSYQRAAARPPIYYAQRPRGLAPVGWHVPLAAPWPMRAGGMAPPPLRRTVPRDSNAIELARRTGGLLNKKCEPCTNTYQCAAGLICDPNSQTCLPRKGECGATRLCFRKDHCPCTGNPFKTCTCEGNETNECPDKGPPATGGRSRYPTTRKPRSRRS